MNINKININQSSQTYYIASDIYDVSYHNNDAVFESLSALLGSDKLSTLIPTAVRCGGMTIRFVQSSNNKYVQYRLMSNEFTTDATQWAIDDESVYVENPEFIYVKTDSEDKILWAIKTDGSIYYGGGVPQQVVDYIEEKLTGFSLDEYEDIVSFLNGLEEGDKTLQTLLNEKVDKEESKSLIDAEYASTKSTINNQEFLEVTTDSQDKILEGIKKDGTKVIGGDIKILGNIEVSGVSYKIIENNEYLAAWVDAEDKVIFGIKADGKTYVGDADFLNDIKNNQKSINEIKSYFSNFNILDINALSSVTTVETHDLIEAKTDSEGKLIAGRTTDGAAFEHVGLTTPKISINGVNIESIEDYEGRTEILTDTEDKIISYRDSDGVKHEEVGIKTNHFELTEQGMTDFQQALKESGFRPCGVSDWSDYISNDGEIPLCIPQPRCAVLNIITDYDLAQLSKEGYKGNPAPIEGETYNIPTQVEFWDMQGNYFKKWTLMSGQGASTMGLPKKSIAFDFFDESVYDSKGKLGKGDVLKIKFGDWIAQDSFHLKAYLYENTKVKSVVAYQLYEEILKSRGIADDYNWKRGLLDLTAITPTNTGINTIDENLLYLDNGATCFPKGFPVIIYCNGDFWGIYMWQIKKHRDNYKMNKSNANHIHLDGEVLDIFSYNGNIDWDVVSGKKPDSAGITDVLEIRNPKDLYLMNGTKYNADTNGGELIDATAVGIYNPENADHVRTANVKVSLVALSRVTSIINDAKGVYEASEKSHQNLETFKAVFETYFDADNLIDYMILSDSILNWDGFNHNIQWTTWNGIKWFANLYDTDNTFGSNTGGSTPMSPTKSHVNYYNLIMFNIILNYYEDKLESRYAELRDLGIIDVNHICEMLTSFQHRINDEFFKMERVKWAASLTDMYDNIYRIYKFLNVQISNMDTLYHYHA